MTIPKNIENIIRRILESETKWKTLYMASWGFVVYFLEPEFKVKRPKMWEEPFRWGLPASKTGWCQYTPKALSEFLRTKDREFTLGHLQTLFSLFEELLKEASKIFFNCELDASKWTEMKEFFGLPVTNNILSGQEIKELKLAKETRNCFIHNDSKVDERWLSAYKDARGNPTANLGDGLEKEFSNFFHQIEDWNVFIVNITKKIQEKIIQK